MIPTAGKDTKKIQSIWAPERIYNEPTTIRVNDEFHRFSVLEGFPDRIPYNQLKAFVRSGTGIEPDFSMFIRPYSRKDAVNRIYREIGEIRSEVGSESQEGRMDRLALDLNKLRRLKDDITNEDLRLFDFGFVFRNRGKSLDELGRSENEAREYFTNYRWANIRFRVKNAFKSILPLGTNYTSVSVPAHTDNVLAFFPFLSSITLEDGGIYYGRDVYTGAPFAVNIWEKAHYDRVIFGQKGSGKSFLVKLIIIREKLMNPDLPVMILDPVKQPEGGGEYGALVKLLGGEVIELSTHGTKNVINPLDPTLSENIESAVDDAITLFSTVFGLSDEERSLLNTALSKLYQGCTSFDDEGGLVVDKEPTISDLLHEIEDFQITGEGDAWLGLVNMKESLKLKLRPYTEGAYRILDNKTNVKLDRDVVSFDVSSVPDSHRPFFMTLVLKYIWRETARSYTPKMVVGDESQLLMDLKLTAEFLERYVRVVRRYHASTVLISQSVMDFMGQPHGDKILENTMMHFLLYHEHLRESVREFYNLSPEEVNIITTPCIGRSFIKCGRERAFVQVDATEAEHGLITTDPREVRARLKGRTGDNVVEQ